MRKISVIVPFYNTARYLRSCITALLSQDYPAEDYEVFLVDNNSTDDSATLARQFPHLTVLTEKKQGAYAARNKGLREAGGEILAFTDADCVPDNVWLRNIVTAAQPAHVRVVLGSRQWAPSPSLLLTMLEAYENQKVAFIARSRIKELYYGYTNNMAVRREAFAALGPFVEQARGADTIFVRRVIDTYSCEAVRYEPNVRVRHLEMNSLWKHYQKMWLYGRSNRLSQPIVSQRPLARSEARQVFVETVRDQGYSRPRARLLSVLTTLEGASYVAGQLAAKWRL